MDGSVTIGGLTPKEVDTVAGMTVGTNHITMRNGRVHSWAVYEPVPDPSEDPIIGPHWGKLPKEEQKIGGFPPSEGWHSPTIYVSHIQSQQGFERIESYGADCMRSRRGLDGKYWEVWMLHTWRLEGKLMSHIDSLDREAKENSPDKKTGLDWKAKAEAVAEFVARTVGAGSVDIVIQRWALSFD